jgi:cytochrome P450
MAVPTSSATCRIHSRHRHREMLGIPAERKEQFKHWSGAAVAAFSLAPDPARFKVAAEEMFEFFVEVIEDRARHPKDDLVSMLVTRGSDGEEPLTVDSGQVTVYSLAGAPCP